MINKDSKVVLDIVEGYLNRALGVKVVSPMMIANTGTTLSQALARLLRGSIPMATLSISL